MTGLTGAGFCPHCGTARDEWAKFCRNCGQAYDGPPPAPAVAPTPVAATQPIAPPAAATPEPAAKAGRSPLGNILTVIGLLIALGVAFYLATGRLPSGSTSGGGGGGGVSTSAKVPPVGVIWFGSSFNPSTFELPADSWLSTKAGQTFALVGHLRSSVQSGTANVRISLDGTTYVNQALELAGGSSGDLVGLTYTAPVQGKYQFDITDLGGQVLATGSIDVRP